uniref:Mevalonate kinase n=1 Tax=Nasutitermes takasagoensis TaxID=62960 RepID=A0A4Y1S352_9NEOP|nr:mevalonate kinase [Nasutitermes takasagoensis]
MGPVKHPLAFTVSAPGKVILHGEHSVVHGKTALAAGLNIRTNVTFKEIDSVNGKITLDLPNLNLQHFYIIQELNDAFLSNPPPLLKGSYSEFSVCNPELINASKFIGTLREYVLKSQPLPFAQECTLVTFLFLYTGIFCSVNVQIQPFSIEVVSDLAVGSGAGSSAAFSVCLAASFIHYIRSKISFSGISNKNVSKDGYKPIEMEVTDLSMFSAKEKELIARWALLGEKVMHGNPSGIDNVLCTFGSIVKFRKGQEGQGPVIEHLPGAAQLKILLVDSGVRRDTAGMVAKVSKRLESYPQVVRSTLDAMDGIAITVADILIQLAESDAEIADTLEQQNSLCAKLEELVDMNQALLNVLGVSHPALDRICRTVSKFGLHAKLTGAGGGGYAFVLLPACSSQQTKVQQMKEELQRKGFVSIETELGSAGITVSNVM